MRIQLRILPEEITKLCNLKEIADADGFFCIEIQGGIYGLPQAGLLAFNYLVQHLAPCGHAPVQHTPGLLTNKKNNVTFTLVVDDFGPKHNLPHNLQHLIENLKAKLTIVVGITENSCIGVALKWN